MTSISQPAVPSQVPSSASQQTSAGPPQSPSPSSTGRAPSTHSGASKKAFSPPPGQHGKFGSESAVNGKVAVPTAPAAVNGNIPNAGQNDLSRKPSVTISASGPQQYVPNGASTSAKPPGGSNIQFGSYNPDGSPRVPYASPHQPGHINRSLGAHNASNPRVTSPANSPSPIPQPAASGGKPPSHGRGISVSFGNSGSPGGPDANLRPAVPGASLGPGSQHLRRESSQSQHSDMMNHHGPGGRGGYPNQGGRGRGGYGGPQYGQQMPYSPQPGHRQPIPHQGEGRGGMNHYQQQQNRGYPGYSTSPHQASRSPVGAQAQPIPQQPGMQQHPGQMSMQNPQMNYSPYGMPGQYFQPGVGPQQVFNASNAYGQDGAYNAQYLYYMNPGQMQGVNQQQRHSSQMGPPGGQMPYGSPYQGQPPPMSRTSSAVSGSDRPSSGMGISQPNASNLGQAGSSNLNARNTASPAPKSVSNSSSFQIPQKKSAIVIRNPDSGDIVDLKKSSASPAPSTKSPANVPAAPTPPVSTPAVVEPPKVEPKNVKTDEEKRAEMRDAIAKKVEADKAEEARRKGEPQPVQDEKPVDSKEKDVPQEAEKVEPTKAAEIVAKKEEPSTEPPKIVEPAREEEDEAAKKAREAKELEDQIAQWEAEEAEAERKEAEREKAYMAKKQAEKDEAARKEAEAFKLDDAEMKRLEKEAEAAEEAKEKARDQQPDSKEGSDVFAALKGETETSSVDTPVAPETPEGSGVLTPASEASGAQRKESQGSLKPKPAALKLKTNEPAEPPGPTPQLLSLRSARKLTQISDVSYPASIQSPSPALNASAATGKFKYDRDFLLQFQRVLTEKPSENWTERIKETLGDGPEPSSARPTPSRSAGSSLGGRQPSQRGPLPTQAMGSFQNQRTLPPGTTSQSRFEASQRGGTAPRPTMQNPLAGFVARPGGGFPQPMGAIKMDRTSSSNATGHPNSPRNASQRGGSQRGSRAGGRREDPKDNKTMPLTAGLQLKPIEVTAGGWKPLSVGANSMAGPAPGGEGHMAPDVVQRKVKSNLNKMTPNNFDKISGQILAIAHQSKDETDGRSLRQVIQLTFEKATDEAHWASMYAQFCHRMLESMSPEIKDESIRDKKGDLVAGGHLFRKYLLTRCQTEFERGWKVNLPPKPEGETEEAALLSDEYYTAAAAKRRGLGLVRFIGELYKLGMLTERIMHECVKKLVDYETTPDEAEVESLTSLLRTIGRQLDDSEKGHQIMDVYFARISQMMALPDLPSRLRFMLMDIVDLRKAKWASKGGVLKGPTTIDEVRAQVAEEERQKDLQRQAENSRRGGGGGGRMPLGRGDVRQMSGGQQFGAPPPDLHKHVGMDDLRKLGSKASNRQVSSQGQTFGPTSMFNTGRGSNPRKPLNIAQRDDSGASSRVSTPPAQKDKEKKEELEAKKNTNAFSALADEATESTPSPASSPALTKSQPAVSRARSKSPLGDSKPEAEASSKEGEKA